VRARLFSIAVVAGGLGCSVEGEAQLAVTTDPPETGSDAAIDGAGDALPDAAADGDAGDAATPAIGPTRYPYGPQQSPMSASIIARAAKVIAATPYRHDVFAKVGASNTVNTNFLHCFAGSDVKLADYAALEPTRAFFRKTLADDTHTSFDRTSLAATVGWGAVRTIAGDPSPIAQEIMAIRPGLSVVMLGTNDTYSTGVDPFERNLRANVDKLLAFGVLPIVSTIPQRSDTAEAIALVPEMNAIIRAVAQAKQVPFIDLASALEPLPGYGLASDGIHLQVYVSGGAHGCWFTADALKLGMNQRNLLTLTALDRVRRFVLDGSAPAEPAPPSLAGKGVWLDPLVVDSIPFVDDRDPRTDGIDQADVYACGTQDESGPEVVYRVDLAAPAKLRIRVFSDEGADLDVHWLDGDGASSCTARADKLLDVDAKAGVHRLVVDTFASGGVAKVGRYRLTMVKL
jgi:hypothetical protein